MVKLEKECGIRCRSRSHAGELVCAVTKGNLRQLQLFLLTCSNATGITDKYHRSVLHMAASCGKWRLIEWLIEDLGMDTTGKDSESGWTALHRALFYGQLTSARLLIQHGASLQTRDREGLCPLDLVMKDRLPYVEFVQSGLQEVYSWGDNSNFTLGHENEQRRRQPEMIDSFRKKAISIKQVVMSKYHTVFVSTSGQVFTCGHGRGGRLGHGNEQTCLEPRLIEGIRHEVCVNVAAARDHTLMLMESGSVYSCGLNDCHQLGQIPPPTASLAPKQMNTKVLKSRSFKGVACNRFHSVLYTVDAVFTFGLNAGQLGHLKVVGEKVITHPRQVSALNHKDLAILCVSCSDAATAVYTSRGDVYVLHEYLCRKVVSRWLGLTEIRVMGGHLDHKMEESLLRERGGSELVIAMLNSSGKVFLWRAQDPVAKRCAWSTKRSLHITNLALTLHSLVFVTEDGDGFVAALPKAKPREKAERVTESLQHQVSVERIPFSLSDLIARDEVSELSIEKLPLVHRATAVTSDRKARNYVLLQCQPNACLTEIPQVSGSEMTSHLERLLLETDAGDVIHDCVLKVGGHSIPAHRYILACRSDHFRKIFIENDSSHEDKPCIEIDNVNYDVFKQMLMYIYTDTCDILTVGKKLDFSISSVNRSVNNNVHMNRNGTEDGCDAIIELDGNIIELDGNNKKMSAYEVREKQKKKSKKGGKKSAGMNGGVKVAGDNTALATQSKNPVTRLQEMGRRFGVKSLTKRLEAVKYQGGVIHSVSGRHLPTPAPRFHQRTFPSLYDVTLKCFDGALIQAHRCLLVARLEYFRSMLASGWIETSTDQPLTLPVPGDVLSIVVDYLYTDSCSELDVCEDIEFLCSVLVVADQLLIPRLRAMCETRIASEVSLKNAAELLEVSSFYNAVQLKTTCQQFVCLNLAAMLESRTLDVVSEDVMEELTQYYREMVPGMNRRRIMPYSGWPSLEHLEKLESRYAGSEVKPAPSVQHNQGGDGEGGRKVKVRKKRGRTKSLGEDASAPVRGERQMSVCSVNSEHDTTLEEVNEEEALSPRQRHNSEAQPPAVNDSIVVTPTSTLVSRLPTLTRQWPTRPTNESISLLTKDTQNTKETTDRHDYQSSMVKPSSAHVAMATSDTGDATCSGVGLREIIAEQEAREKPGSAQRSVGSKYHSSAKKLSQKERKRLAKDLGQTSQAESLGPGPPYSDTSLSQTEAEGISCQGAKPKAWGTSNPWSGDSAPNNLVQSFKDLMVSEEKVSVKTSPLQVLPPSGGGKKQTASATDLALSWGLTVQQKPRPEVPPRSPASPESPRENPWQPLATSPVSPGNTATSLSFTDIVLDEARQRETLKKATNKPLALIQIEEEAKTALIRHYTTTCSIKDAKLSIERVQVQMATPTWAAKQTKHA